MPKRKPWSTTVEAHGIAVRVYERTAGSPLYLSVVVNGRKDRKSLKHRDRQLAEEQARELAAHLAEAQLTRRPLDGATFGQVRALYLAHRGPLLRPARLSYVERTLELWAAHLEPAGRRFTMDDFGQTHADAYAQARQSGRLHSRDHRASRDGVRAGTIRNELQVLSTVCNWAVGWKVDGRRLLAHNPVRDVEAPKEANPLRPVASAARYRKLVAVANTVDPSGQFRLALVLAYHTGRRINAILHLRASDVLTSREAVGEALAEMGLDESWAAAWPQAIRWRQEWDKAGFASLAPFGADVRAELDAYLRRSPKLGEAWLFESARKPGTPTLTNAANWWLWEAEKAAGLPHQKRGGWHAFRRAWATARRALPVQDVMHAGGWRDVKALQRAYQQPDPKTILRVVEMG